MKTYLTTITPLTAFGTQLAGDTLFGQLCWALRNRYGDDKLSQLLQGYTEDQPFLVVGDAFPHSFIPLPTLPLKFWVESDPKERKANKKKIWLALEKLANPLAQWQGLASTDAEAAAASSPATTAQAPLKTERAQAHNTLNRQSGSTGTGQFAPFTQNQIWYQPGVKLDMVLVLDENRISAEEIQQALSDIGQIGYGRDASIGLGKFTASPLHEKSNAEAASTATHYLTLGACAPQGQGFCPTRSYYQTFTRFGRHGDQAVHSGKPFKKPIQLAKAGGVFMPDQMSARQFIGQGLGGVSLSDPRAVSQGYAPVIAIQLPTAATGKE